MSGGRPATSEARRDVVRRDRYAILLQAGVPSTLAKTASGSGKMFVSTLREHGVDPEQYPIDLRRTGPGGRKRAPGSDTAERADRYRQLRDLGQSSVEAWQNAKSPGRYALTCRRLKLPAGI